MGFPSTHHPSPCPRRASASLGPVETQDWDPTGCSLTLRTPSFGSREVSSLWRLQQPAGLPVSSSTGCGLGGGGAETGHTEPALDLTSDPSCFRRDLLPFTLRLPRAILEARSSTDLEIISNLGLGKSPPGSEQETGL